MKQVTFLFITILFSTNGVDIPLVINTWRFTTATDAAWNTLNGGGTAKDALVVGCARCEQEQCDHTVGYGGSPDENGETTLDAMIFDGSLMDMGAVGGLRRIKNAIAVARDILDLTDHSFLIGDSATQFAKSLGYKEENLSTSYSHNVWLEWNTNECQPNFWKNVLPDPKTSCGPYEPIRNNDISYTNRFSSGNHDTIGMIVIDEKGKVFAGTSTNGANHKIPGRVGDSPIPGAGAYADSDFGAAVATGDGDIMMRFLPSFLAVEKLRQGSSPTEAAKIAIKRITQKYPDFFGAVLVVDKKGVHGAACNGMVEFPFSFVNYKVENVTVETVKCETTGVH